MIQTTKKSFIFLLTEIIILSLLISNCNKEPLPEDFDEFTDPRDGQVYKFIKIGNQFWMSENLRFKPDSGNYWVYNNNAAYFFPYGYLYDWETANNVCPTGWHLPSNAEWIELSDYLGGEQEAAGKMKDVGTKHWNPPNSNATNESGFTALPGGSYMGNSSNIDIFEGLGNLAYFWSAEPSLNIWWLSTNSYLPFAHSWIDTKIEEAVSVRCVKD